MSVRQTSLNGLCFSFIVEVNTIRTTLTTPKRFKILAQSVLLLLKNE